MKKNDYEKFLFENGIIHNSTEIKEVYKLNDDYNLGFIIQNNQKTIIFITNGDEFFNETVQLSKNSKKQKYIAKLTNADVLIGDFSFDENIDVLRLFYNPPIGLGINGIIIENKILCIDYCEIQFPGYSYITNNDTCEILYYEGNNPRINSEYYLSLDDFQFCIINNKRGMIVKSIGQVFKETPFHYAMNITKNDKNTYSFFYWDKEQQRYILDESVTQEQLKNAYCLEDYFAYNGLKFSKLGARLTEADLKGLDKAQLRLMRNAVYTRHGRTFKSVDLQSLWECYAWYKKNPAYTDDLLTETDRHNIELIKRFESQ